MLQFFYDSLDTLKKVKKPTTKEVRNLTIGLIVVVIIAWVFFSLVDGAFAELYKTFYSMMKWQ